MAKIEETWEQADLYVRTGLLVLPTICKSLTRTKLKVANSKKQIAVVKDCSNPHKLEPVLEMEQECYPRSNSNHEWLQC